MPVILVPPDLIVNPAYGVNLPMWDTLSHPSGNRDAM
jgi:hypothetical protein